MKNLIYRSLLLILCSIAFGMGNIDSALPGDVAEMEVPEDVAAAFEDDLCFDALISPLHLDLIDDAESWIPIRYAVRIKWGEPAAETSEVRQFAASLRAPPTIG